MPGAGGGRRRERLPFLKGGWRLPFTGGIEHHIGPGKPAAETHPL